MTEPRGRGLTASRDPETLPAEGLGDRPPCTPSLLQASVGITPDLAQGESCRGRCAHGHVMQVWPMTQKDRSPGDSGSAVLTLELRHGQGNSSLSNLGSSCYMRPLHLRQPLCTRREVGLGRQKCGQVGGGGGTITCEAAAEPLHKPTWCRTISTVLTA